ncbi:putative lipid A export permease/ATP-binding protein [Candidatus Hepatincolaceae symbiont of Richtersius coronifer]
MFKLIIKKIFRIKSDNQIKDVYIPLKRFSKDMIKPNLFFIIIAMIAMAFASMSTGLMAWLIKPIINQVFVFKEINYVYKIGFSIMAISIVKAFSQYFSIILLTMVSVRVIALARKKLYSNFLKQDMQFYHNNSPGTLISVLMNDINAMNNFATDIPINFSRDFFTFLSLFVVMYYQEPVYASVIFLSIFFVVIPIRILSKKIKGYFRKTNAGFGVITSHLEQVFNGIREVKSYGMENKEKKYLGKIIDDLAKVQIKVGRVSLILPSIMELMGGISVAAILIYGGYSVVYNGKDPGSFFSFIAALLFAYQPLKRLSEFTIKIQLGLLGINRYYSFLDERSKIKDYPQAQEFNFAEAEITFKDVNFSYVKERPVLKNVNFTIKKGQKIALVGRSGGGKTTILNLMGRFYEQQSGDVLINNINNKDFTLKSLRDQISFVSQDVILFDDTIYNNIAYSANNRPSQDVIQAARDAYCFDFIEDFPDKFDTQVGSRGMKLSGGQRQRLSIARALYKNAPILLLDEATSALDTESELQIQNALSKLMVNKTSIVIAHRLSTIIKSDTIFVIDKGAIVEQGDHDSLLAKNGLYKYLYDLQFKNQENHVSA